VWGCLCGVLPQGYGLMVRFCCSRSEGGKKRSNSWNYTIKSLGADDYNIAFQCLFDKCHDSHNTIKKGVKVH